MGQRDHYSLSRSVSFICNIDRRKRYTRLYFDLIIKNLFLHILSLRGKGKTRRNRKEKIFENKYRLGSIKASFRQRIEFKLNICKSKVPAVIDD
jgi:hypothetical protein